jgi:hypothetical protein
MHESYHLTLSPLEKKKKSNLVVFFQCISFEEN